MKFISRFIIFTTIILALGIMFDFIHTNNQFKAKQVITMTAVLVAEVFYIKRMAKEAKQIARELREEKQREQELKKHLKDCLTGIYCKDGQIIPFKPIARGSVG